MSLTALSQSSAQAGPSNGAEFLPPLSELIRRSAKRTRALYNSDFNEIDDGLASASVEHQINFVKTLNV